MKRVKLASAVLVGLAAFGAANLQADTNVVANGTTWTYTYEGNVLPNDPAANPAWAKYFATAATESVSNGILTISGPAIGDYVDYSVSSSLWAPTAAGSTIEFRLKVDSEAASTPRGAQSLIVYDGSQMFYIGLATNKVFDPLVSGTPGVVMDTTSAFHVYRLAITGATGPASVYVDGSPVAAFTTPGVSLSPSQTHLDFGINSSAEAGTIQWDYIRWTNAGAFPVPEASSSVLILLGAAGVLTRFNK